jgi:hypothetical protein
VSPAENCRQRHLGELRVGRMLQEHVDVTQVPRLWSAKAIASRWNLSRMQVYRAHKAGRLTGYSVLGTLRFLEDDVLRLLEKEGVPVGETKRSSP